MSDSNYDPVLTELSHKLRAVTFFEHAGDKDKREAQKVFREGQDKKLQDPAKQWHNVNRLSMHVRHLGYLVRFVVLGKTQILGRSFDNVTACRFADMCVRRLDRFRSKKYPARYNFSEEQAIADERDCPAARELLDQIEARVVTMQQENAPRQDRIGKLEAMVEDNFKDLLRRVYKLEKALGL